MRVAPRAGATGRRGIEFPGYGRVKSSEDDYSSPTANLLNGIRRRFAGSSRLQTTCSFVAGEFHSPANGRDGRFNGRRRRPHRLTGSLADGFRVLIALLLVAVSAPARADDMRPPILRDVGIDQRLNEQVPLDLVFRDETGEPVQLSQYFGGKPVVLSLAYYECPMLCTLVLNGMASALKVLSFDIGDQFNVVTVSFNPHDTPALAAAKKDTYVKEYGRRGAADGWHFLTGDAASIERLTRAVGFRYAYDPAQKQYAHAAGIMVLTPRGKIARYFYGVEFAPRDLRLGLVEAADNRIGSPVDQLLLFCFHYDPATGKYGALAINSVRVGGGLTVLALATFLVVMWRRERAQHAEPMVPPFEKGGLGGICGRPQPQPPVASVQNEANKIPLYPPLPKGE